MGLCVAQEFGAVVRRGGQGSGAPFEGGGGVEVKVDQVQGLGIVVLS